MKISIINIIIIILIANFLFLTQCTVTLPASSEEDEGVSSSLTSSASSNSSSSTSSIAHIPVLQGLTANSYSINLAGDIEIYANVIDSENDITQVTVKCEGPEAGDEKVISLIADTVNIWKGDIHFNNTDNKGEWIITEIILFDSVNNQRQYRYIPLEDNDSYVYFENGSYIDSNVPILKIIKQSQQ
ncbi:MAG: hypothetical protein JXB50_01215 [Spirochaetes bacterium]|nr:hypothetical protein [Spirochaetota bacterium]